MIEATQGLPFEATCSGAPTGLVGSMTVEVYNPADGSSVLAPTTAGITEPRTGTYAVTLTVSQLGDLMVRWTYPGATAPAEEELVVSAVTSASTSPTVADLSSLMRARTQGELSYQGEFNSETLPTDVQAGECIGIAEAIVAAKLGASIPSALAPTVQKAILFKAAALVEISYYPEQANDDNSAYSLYEDQFEKLLSALADALADNQPNAVRWGSIPTLGRNGYVYVPPPTV